MEGERIVRNVRGDDDGDRIKNGAIHVTTGVEQHLMKFGILAVAFGKFAINVFDHDDGAVNDDSEVDGTNGEEVGSFAGKVQKNKREKQCQGNGERSDDGGPDPDQEENQNDEKEKQAAEKMALN